MLQTAAGDEKAFTTLFYAYHQKLGAYVLAWTKSVSMAEEIVQDVFLKIWNNRTALAQVSHFEKYLYTVSRNYTFNSLRQLARERVRRQEWLRYVDNADQIPADLPQEDYGPLIEQAIRQLSPQQQKVYHLKKVEGLKYEDIGLRLGIAPETARKHLAVAMQHIRVYVQTHINITLLIMSTPLLLSQAG